MCDKDFMFVFLLFTKTLYCTFEICFYENNGHYKIIKLIFLDVTSIQRAHQTKWNEWMSKKSDNMI